MCLFSRWQRLIPLSVFQHFNSLFFFQILLRSEEVNLHAVFSFFFPSHCFSRQVSINLGNCVFKWQDKGKISEHDPNLKRLSSPADTNVGTETRVVLMLSQLSSLLFLKIDFFFFFGLPHFLWRFKIPSEVRIKLLLVCDDKKKNNNLKSGSNRPRGSNEMFRLVPVGVSLDFSVYGETNYNSQKKKKNLCFFVIGAPSNNVSRVW